MKRLCFLVALSVAALLLLCGPASADPSSLNRALEMIASTKPPPLHHMRPDPYRYARLMEQNGRLAELGLTFEEGVTFAEAALVRQGVKFAAPRTFADSGEAGAPPAGPVHKAGRVRPDGRRHRQLPDYLCPLLSNLRWDTRGAGWRQPDHRVPSVPGCRGRGRAQSQDCVHGSDGL